MLYIPHHLFSFVCQSGVREKWELQGKHKEDDRNDEGLKKRKEKVRRKERGSGWGGVGEWVRWGGGGGGSTAAKAGIQRGEEVAN